MAAKVKITSSEEIQKANLTTLFKNQNIPIKNIYILPQKRENCYVFFHTDDDADKTFSDDCTSALAGAGYNALPNEKTLANRTVFIRNIDRDIKAKDEDAILKAINSENHAIKASKVVKINNSRIIKVVLKSREMALKVIEHGIYIDKLSLRDIEVENYVEVIVCLKCYQLGDHLKESCPKAADYKCCSTCASEEHTHHSCSSEQIKCINCKEDHYTLAKKCKKRKELIEKLRKSTKETTYASKVTITPSASPNANSILESAATKAFLEKKIDTLTKIVENQSKQIADLMKMLPLILQQLATLTEAIQLKPNPTIHSDPLPTPSTASSPPHSNLQVKQDSTPHTAQGNLSFPINADDIKIVLKPTNVKTPVKITKENIRELHKKRKIEIKSTKFSDDYCIELLENQIDIDVFLFDKSTNRSRSTTAKNQGSRIINNSL